MGCHLHNGHTRVCKIYSLIYSNDVSVYVFTACMYNTFIFKGQGSIVVFHTMSKESHENIIPVKCWIQSEDFKVKNTDCHTY